MKRTKSLLGNAARWFMVLMCLLICGQVAYADENFVAGVYQDTSGNQYLVQGGAPSTTGRTQWTITSTTPAAGKTNTFNAIWETGAAVGNAFLPGNNNVLNYPAGYASGRSYGIASGNISWGYFNDGNVISVSQVGTTLVIARLNSDGSVYHSQTLSYVSAGGATSASTTTYQSGTYQDSSGNQYLITGGAPSQPGRTQWTITSTTPKAGTTNTFNAIWETGAAVGNAFLPGNNNVLNYPAGYASGRSYGIASGNISWGYFNDGNVISVSQVGTTLVIARLNSDGSVYHSQTLSYVSAGGATSASTTTYQSGTYQDTSGNQYLVTGAACVSNDGQWSIKSTTPKLAGTTNTFNANWITGAATSNSYLAGDNDVLNYSAGYTSGRSYGIASGNISWGYFNDGNVISVSQVGTTLVVARLNSDGSVYHSQTLSYVSAAPSQTIISYCVSPASIVPGGTSTIGGTATSGLAVSYTSTTPNICSVSGTTVTGVAVGTCTIAANQAGNTTYNAAPQMTQNITVSTQPDCIFNWAEQNFAQYFNPAATTTTYAQYSYRYYSGTGNYLAVSSADNSVYVLGASFGGRLLNVGPVTSFLGVSGCQ